MTKKEEEMDYVIIIIALMCVIFPIAICTVPSAIDSGVSTWGNSIFASTACQYDIINGKMEIVRYGLSEGTYELKPLEGYGSYIKTSPPFNYFADGFDDMFIFSTDEGLVGLYVYGKHGIHVGKWSVHDIKYDDSVPPSVTVTSTDDDWLRYDFVIPDYKYMTIGEWTIEDMEKYCHD